MRTRHLASFALAIALAACGDKQVAGPSSLPPQQPLHNAMLGVADGVEYEMDTGVVACPAILNSHVKYWVNINGVGPRLFTFFAPHVRQTYLGNGVYRYRMTLGRSDDNQWLAEGSWTGKCFGYGQWGIGKVLSFEGTVWRTDSGGDDGDCGTIRDPVYLESYDPYAPDAEVGELTASCGGGGGGGGGGEVGITARGTTSLSRYPTMAARRGRTTGPAGRRSVSRSLPEQHRTAFSSNSDQEGIGICKCFLRFSRWSCSYPGPCVPKRLKQLRSGSRCGWHLRRSSRPNRTEFFALGAMHRMTSSCSVPLRTPAHSAKPSGRY